MSRRTHRRLFASLCLSAMLLLAALPTAGRLAGQHVVDVLMPAQAGITALSAPRPVEAHHASHLSPAHATAAHHDAGTPASDGHPGHDCPYCPLLAGLASIDVPPRLPAALPACRAFVPGVAGLRVVSIRTSCLGSRGPPERLNG